MVISHAVGNGSFTSEALVPGHKKKEHLSDKHMYYI
jgi:hypothetical protein